MKLSLEVGTFIDAITWVTKLYDTKDTTAYVGLLVNSSLGKASIFHSNSTSFMSAPLDLLDSEFSEDESEEKELKFPLDGQYLKRLAGAIPGSKNASVHIMTEKNSIKLKGPSGNFTIPKVLTKVNAVPSLKVIGEVNNHQFFDTLQRLSKICDSSNTGANSALSDVDLSIRVDDKKLIAMATDRYAMGVIGIDFYPGAYAEEMVNKHSHILLQANGAKLIPPSKDIDSKVDLIFEEKSQKFGYKFDDRRVALFSLHSATPIAYENMKNGVVKDLVNSVKVEVKELQNAINSISKIAWDENEIYLTITKNNISVYDKNKTNNVIVPVENATMEKDEYHVTFIRSVLNEGFSPVTTTHMNVKWKQEKQPIIFEPLLDDDTPQKDVVIFMMVR